MNRIEMLAMLGVASLLAIPNHSSAQWTEFRQQQLLQFANGYFVTKDPRANSEVVKFIPGPTEANIGGSFRNEAGVVFYLSD